jgi:ATP-binding protein involved in chromosome partitioning
MNKDSIIEILKKINYPNYSRDIVSFGIIESIDLSDNIILLKLKLNTNEEIINSIKNDINTQLKSNFPSFKIDIQINKSEEKVNIISDIKALKDVKYIVAIASGKGGVGKSTTAVNLASILSKKFKVGILDLDIYGPSLPTALNIHEKPKMSENNFLVPIEKDGMKLMSFGFLNNESAPTIWRGPMVSRMTQQFFEQVEWGELDILFLDLPPGTGDIQLTLVQKIALSGAIIVTTPQDLALLDVKKASDMFNKLNTPILGVVENMSNLLLEGSVKNNEGNFIDGSISINNAEHKIKDGKFTIDFSLFKGQGGSEESHRLGVPLLSKIPVEPELAICTDMGTPYVQKHTTYVTECFEEIGQKIIETLFNE